MSNLCRRWTLVVFVASLSQNKWSAVALAPGGKLGSRTLTTSEKGPRPRRPTALWREACCAALAAQVLLAPLSAPATNLVTETCDLLEKYYYQQGPLAQTEYKLDRQRLETEAAVKGADGAKLRAEALKSLKADRYTRLLDQSTYRAISRFDVLGVGLILSPGDDGVARVVSPPLPGSAAERSKAVRQGDAILAINGQQTKGLSSFEILDIVDIAPDQKTVQFRIRDSENVESDLSLQRQLGAANVQDVPIDRYSCKDGVGYVHMAEFSAKVASQLETVLGDLDAKGCDSRLVLDVRGNPGGAFQSAIGAASLFVPSGTPVVTVVEQSKSTGEVQQETFRTKRDVKGVGEGKKVQVWVDGRSASSSEIFAGALRDNCAAVIAGNSKSFGKGLIQAVFGLADDSGLVVTVAQYRTPNGDVIQGLGIQPEAPLPPPSFPLGPVPVPGKAGFDLAYDPARARKQCAAQ